MATVTDNAENISITIESSVELRCPREKENEELRRDVVNFFLWLFSFLKKQRIIGGVVCAGSSLL